MQPECDAEGLKAFWRVVGVSPHSKAENMVSDHHTTLTAENTPAQEELSVGTDEVPPSFWFHLGPRVLGDAAHIQGGSPQLSSLIHMLIFSGNSVIDTPRCALSQLSRRFSIQSN